MRLMRLMQINKATETVHSRIEQPKMKVEIKNCRNKRNPLTVFSLLLAMVLALFVNNPSFAQGATNPNPNDHSVEQIMATYMLRHKAADQYHTADTVRNQESQGPGTVSHGGPENNPIQVWPTYIPTAQSQVPTLRDTAITRNMFKTFGYPLSDTQYQVIERYNQNRFMEQLYNPEKAHWMAQATGGLAANSAANSMAAFAINQALSAIDFCRQFLTNFTAEPDNVWQRIRDQLFVPMAILLLLPGAVLAQVKAIVAQGSPVLVGDVHPFEGLLRSIVAIFLIPGTFLVINYGIDVANSITLTIADEYRNIFGSDMYEDAKCAIVRAFPMNKPEWNRNAIGRKEVPRFVGTGNWARLEGHTIATARIDPCAGVEESRVPDEDVVQSKNINRLMMNGLNDTATMSWNLSCAFQMAFLYYLWCMGPIAAALWVWPVQQMRGALASWIDGVITVCFWSLFWNTTILLMACFRGVGDSGTIIMTALIFLAVNSVKSAFDFAALASAAVGDAAAQAQKVAGAAKGGGAGGGNSSGGGAAASNQGSGQRGGTGSSVGSSGGGGGGGGGGGSDTGRSASIGGTAPKSDSVSAGQADNASGVPSTKSGVGSDGLGGSLPVTAGSGTGDKGKVDGAQAEGETDQGLPPPSSGEKAGSTGGSGDGPPTGDAGGAGAAALTGALGSASIDASGNIGLQISGDAGSGTLGITNSGDGLTGPGGVPLTGESAASGDGNKFSEGTAPLLGFGMGNSDSPIQTPFGLSPELGNRNAFDALGLGPDLQIPGLGNEQGLGALGIGNAQGQTDGKGAIPGTDIFGKPDATGLAPGTDIFGKPDATGLAPGTENALNKLGPDGQPLLGADGKPMLDPSRVGDVPPLTGNLANDPGAVSAQKTAVDTMAMSGITTDQLKTAIDNPNSAEYKAIADATNVAPPILDAALHGNTSAGVMTAVGFGGTDTANAFAAPGVANETATMATNAFQQAQNVAGADPGMIDRATLGMDAKAGAQLLNSPAMDAQFASTVSGYQQAYGATGSYAQTDGQYASAASFGTASGASGMSGISPSMVGGDLSPAGSIASANNFQSPYSVTSGDAGAVSAQRGAADIMALTNTTPQEMQRALANPNGAEYQALTERMGSSPALVDAALHGSAAAGAIVETGFGQTPTAAANADTSFTANQSVAMYQAAASNYGADTVQQAAVNMNASAGAQILQSAQMDQQFASTVQSYQQSYQTNGNYASADAGYVNSFGSTPAVTSSLVTGDVSPSGAVASSMGYSAPYSVPAGDAGAISAQRGAADIMAMTHTTPVEMREALANPGGAQYQALTERLGSSPALVDAALHGSTAAGAIVETGFGSTATAQANADTSYTAQQSVSMYQAAATQYGADTVQQAAVNMNAGAGAQILQSAQMDQQFASTVQSYQQSYQSGGNFTQADTSYVSSGGASPAITSAIVGGEASPAGSYASAAGYSAPYSVSSSDPGAVSAQNTARDIMAMTNTSPTELRTALAQPESQQYQQLAERMGASPALIDSALHGNVSSAVVASAGFGATETAHRFESQSVTAAQSIQYNASAQAAGGGADAVYQAAVNLNPEAGQRILGGTGLDTQYTATVNAYRAEAASGGGYTEAPVVPNYITSSGGSAPMSQDMISGTNQAQYSYGAQPGQTVTAGGSEVVQQQLQQQQQQQQQLQQNYVADAGIGQAQRYATEPGYVQPQQQQQQQQPYVADGGVVQQQQQQQQQSQPYVADSGMGQQQQRNVTEPGFVQPQQNYVADPGAGQHQAPGVGTGQSIVANNDLGYTGSTSSGWTAPQVLPDVTSGGTHHAVVQPDQHQHVEQQQQQVRQDSPGYIADGGPRKTFSNILGAGAAGLAAKSQEQSRPSGGAPNAEPKETAPSPQQKEGAPPTEGNKGVNLTPGQNRKAKTQRELDEEQRRLLEEQRRNMPGFNGD